MCMNIESIRMFKYSPDGAKGGPNGNSTDDQEDGTIYINKEAQRKIENDLSISRDARTNAAAVPNTLRGLGYYVVED